MNREIYENPLITRYASKEMAQIFSDDKKFRLWRKLWIALAESEKELGLPITQSQIDAMKKYADDINYEVAEAREKEVRHDVMSHVYAFGTQAKEAMPIIHLGATSCYVTDNAELLILKEALELIQKKLVAVMDKLRKFALTYKDLPTLGFTHLQPAQLTTVGKRASLWLQDLLLDYENITHTLSTFRLRGVKGTTGTQASFLSLFDGDGKKVDKLEALVTKKMGLSRSFGVTGQTYPRKFDYNVIAVLSMVAQSAYKFAGDLRVLQNMKEMEEPFEKSQIGSSAMAYKRNPMRSERMCALARFVVSLPVNEAMTACTQWFERTLDDSANKRVTLAQAFLALDGVLNLYNNIAENMVVYEKIIRKHIMAELPFMATEEILMACVKAGGNRQELHEKIRTHSMESARMVKADGKDNDLIDRIKADPAFKTIHGSIDKILLPENFIGRAAEQTEQFIKEEVDPILANHKDALSVKAEINV
ncbi:MAG: adenylosuccinate lyase [Clostridiales bacterium]|nr:adenylosuccinate lyase [Clostridiales bacterium]